MYHPASRCVYSRSGKLKLYPVCWEHLHSLCLIFNILESNMKIINWKNNKSFKKLLKKFYFWCESLKTLWCVSGEKVEAAWVEVGGLSIIVVWEGGRCHVLTICVCCIKNGMVQRWETNDKVIFYLSKKLILKFTFSEEQKAIYPMQINTY